MENILLFLTGCIDPSGMSQTLLQNKTERRKQYIDTIKYYLIHYPFPLLFVENSGNDISGDLTTEIESGRLELLTFEGNNFDKSLGKGYGEMKIINYAINNSTFMTKSGFIFKLTGRLKLLNFQTYLNHYAKNKEANVFVDLRQTFTVGDSRFWGAKNEFFRNYLLKYQDLINDSSAYYFEHALCYASLDVIKDRERMLLFKQPPRFEGVSGTDGTSYKTSYFKWLFKSFIYKLKYLSLRYT